MKKKIKVGGKERGQGLKKGKGSSEVFIVLGGRKINTTQQKIQGPREEGANKIAYEKNGERCKMVAW